MKKLFLLLICTGAAVALYGQQPDASLPPAATARPVPGKYTAEKISYVRTWTPSKKMTDPSLVSNLTDVRQVKQFTVYLDGLGRSIQEVSKGMTLYGEDIIQPRIYDHEGKEAFQYLPYANFKRDYAGTFRSYAFTEQAAFLAGYLPNETIYYGKTNFEPEPDGRPIFASAPGNSWTGAGKGTTTQYLLNTDDEDVVNWDITLSAGAWPTRTGEYLPGTLYKVITTSEDNSKTITYTDRNGKLLLRKIQFNATPGVAHDNWLCTYYVYDAIGNLRYVIQPKAVETLRQNNWDMTNATLRKELCFIYEYDSKNRLILKQVPGAESEEYVYDLRDRVVFSQDGNLRNGTPKKWKIVTYDAQNRTIMNGLYTTNQTRQQLAAEMATSQSTGQYTYQVPVPADLFVGVHDGRSIYTAGNSIEFTAGFTVETGMETIISPGATSGSVTIPLHHPLPTLVAANVEPLGYTFFDDYSYEGPKPIRNDMLLLPAALPGQADYKETPSGSILPRNQETGGKVKVPGANVWLTTSVYYDRKGRLVQEIGDNIGGGIDISSTMYNFSGQPVSTHVFIRNPASGTLPELRILTKFDYDDAGRLSTVFKKMNDGTERKIITNDYDRMGLLETKKFLKPDGSTLESMTYGYNVRGWLKSINKTHLTGAEMHYFGEEIAYDHGFANKKLDGNISGIKWKGAPGSPNRAYAYSYDPSGRLAGANYTQEGNPNTWSAALADYSVTNMAYDHNGNITSMHQKGMQGASKVEMDKLTYNYVAQSNRLDGVSEPNSTNYNLQDFTDRNAGTDYLYDKNGNITQDLNKQIASITYNTLNQPELITFQNNAGTIRFYYTADGDKVRKVVNDLTGTQPKTTTTDYIRGALFENGRLLSVPHEEGRIRPKFEASGSVSFVYDFFMKDHLGSVRSVLTDDAAPQQLYVATMETAKSETETKLFSNIDDSRYHKPTGYPDPEKSGKNEFVARLNGKYPEKRIGPSIVLKVMPGDTVQFSAKVFYKSTGPKTKDAPVPAADMATALIKAFGMPENSGADKSGVIAGGATGAGADNFLNNSYQRLKQKSPGQEGPGQRPKAYMSYVLFDDQMQMVEQNSGIRQVQEKPDEVQVLGKDKMVIEKGGFLYIYASNESQQDVYFDDVVVLNSPGPLLEENHYYPFGLTMAGISSASANIHETNKTLFSGKELQNKELSSGGGLNLYDFGARMYDPQIGRWHVIDPMSDKYQPVSPYNYTLNNPVLFIDPDGTTVIGSDGKEVTYKRNEDGTIVWSANATEDIKTIGNAMLLTEIGEKAFNMWQKADTKVNIQIDRKSDNSINLAGTTPRKNNLHQTVNKDGQYIEVDVIFYEKAMKEDIAKGSGSRFEGASMEETFGATGVHEVYHNEPSQIRLDYKTVKAKKKELDQNKTKNLPMNAEVDYRKEYRSRNSKLQNTNWRAQYDGYNGLPEKKKK